MSFIEDERKPVALIDLDGTIYQGYRGLILEDIVENQMSNGLIKKKWRVLDLVSHIINYHHGQKGHPSTTEDLNYCWADVCEEIPHSELLNHARGFVKQHRERFYPYTQPVLDLLTERGIDTWLITGEPDFVAQAVREEFRITGSFATIWKQKRGIITGGVKILVNSYVKGKCADVLFHPNHYNYNRANSFALVDSVNDIGLVNAVPISVVCGQPDEAFNYYLERCRKTYVIASPERMVNFVDRLTKPTK